MRLSKQVAGWGFMALAGWVAAQEAPPLPEADAPLLSLGTSAWRESLEARHPALVRWPDLRLRLENTGEFMLDPANLEPQLRSIEIRLPMSHFWVGYEWPSGGEDPRATVSLLRGF